MNDSFSGDLAFLVHNASMPEAYELLTGAESTAMLNTE